MAFKKSLLYRFSGVGRLPVPYALTFAAEGVVLSDEGLKGSRTIRNFHRPGEYSSYRKTAMIASIVVTNKRLAAYNGNNPIIDVEFADERLHQIAFSVEPNGALLAAFDASLFHDDWSGQIEYRFKTNLAQQFVDHIRQKLRKQ